MQLGQIVDYCIEVQNQEAKAEKKQDKKKEQKKRRATQADIDAFFGPPRSRHG